VEIVSRTGDKLIRETPFRYRLTLNPANSRFDRLHFVDFGRTFGLGKAGTAYACTELVSTVDTVMTIEIEHNDACKIWCNNEQVYEKKGKRSLHLVQEERSIQLSDSFALPLKKGRNTLLIKSETAGKEWKVFLQPPGEKDAVLNYSITYPAIGLQQAPDVDKSIAGITPWLVIGPFAPGIDKIDPPEKEIRFGYMYGDGLTWTIPKIEILGDVINPAPWGTTYQWNYHNGGVAWAMQQLSEITGDSRYAQWGNNFCDYQIEGIPFVRYQVDVLNVHNSANFHILNNRMLDFTLAPALPFIYRLRKEDAFNNRKQYAAFIARMIDYARNGQIRSENMRNYTRETPEKYTTWVDDMFMGIPFLMQAGLYAASPEEKQFFFDDAAAQILDFSKHVWNEEAQLYMHANYSTRPGVKLPHWSRANGWAIWAMSEVLLYLPENHPLYEAVLRQYKAHVAALLRHQDASGFWRNVIDRPDSPIEVSGTAIFTMAIARGVRLGWLNETDCKPAVMNGWKAVASQIEADGTVHKICVGTMCSEDINYYINRPFYDDDTHGSFAVLFAGMEVQKMLDAQKSVHFQPVRLSPEEIRYLEKDLQCKDKLYNPQAKMLMYITKERHYHSDLDSGAIVHQTRESLEYAVALLKTGDKDRRSRALDIIRAVLPLQEKDPHLPYCGIWPYYPEDPLKNREKEVDYNWADFIAVPLIDILINHPDCIGKELEAEIKEALILAAQSIKKRNVQPDYTNICIMGTYVCYVVGEICYLPEMTEYARKRLHHFYEYTLHNNGFTEYNSPTYTLIALDELLRMQQVIIHPDDRKIIDALYRLCWDGIARHFHQPSGQWCGPNLRAYNSLTEAKHYRLFYNASGGQINLPGDYPRIPNVLAPHKIPENILPKFTESLLPRLEIDTFVVATDAEKDIIGKLYAAPSFALASVNKGYMWNQTRPLIAHWGTPEKPSYLRVRFLNNGYDFSAANITCIQDTTTVIAIFNIAEDGGLTHPGLDRMKDACIRTQDLRLRIEAGGDLTATDFSLPQTTSEPVNFVSRAIHSTIRIPYANWDGEEGYWEKGSDGITQWIDYVLYSGKERFFHFDRMQEAVVGLYLTIAADDNNAPAAIKVEKEAEYLSLSNRNLKIKALLKPDRELRLKKDYETKHD
jgi:rhamnogalacturonyl hydrolase YesR